LVWYKKAHVRDGVSFFVVSWVFSPAKKGEKLKIRGLGERVIGVLPPTTAENSLLH
jgi:hypothetical protein